MRWVMARRGAWLGVLVLGALAGPAYAEQPDCEAVVAQRSICAQLRDHDAARRSAALRALGTVQSHRGEAAARLVRASDRVDIALARPRRRPRG